MKERARGTQGQPRSTPEVYSDFSPSVVELLCPIGRSWRGCHDGRDFTDDICSHCQQPHDEHLVRYELTMKDFASGKRGFVTRVDPDNHQERVLVQFWDHDG